MVSWSRAVPARASPLTSGQEGPQGVRTEARAAWVLVPLPTEVPCGGCQRKLFRWDSALDLCNRVRYINVMLLISLRRLQYVWKDTVLLHWCVASLCTWDQEREWQWWWQGDSSRSIIPHGSSPFCVCKGIGAKIHGKTEKKRFVSHCSKLRREEHEHLSLNLPISVCKHNES